MKALIVAGGVIETEFAINYINKQSFQFIIGVDRGSEFLYEAGIVPYVLMGDFDSISPEVLTYFDCHQVPLQRFQAKKNETDLELAINRAVEEGSSRIIILGATGGRLDHFLGNLQSLSIAERKGVSAYIVDAHNRIRLLMEPLTLKRDEQYGKYVSFFPLTTKVTGLNLTGFAYPLTNHTLTSEDSLGVSNEIKDEKAYVEFRDGILIMVESRD